MPLRRAARRASPVLVLAAVAAALGGLSAQSPPPKPQPPLTAAEATDYKATSRYADVMAFLRELQKQSPYLRVETLCRSTEGFDVPLVIVGNPVPASPFEPRASKKAVIYIQANIHAGEVEGKEASLMVLRDIFQRTKLPYLDRLVLLIAPIFNADGNEKISPANRRQQPGPEQGVGVRPNGQNLDLNRDAIKAESPEVQGLLRNILNRWDPVLLVDCHTTNGAYHEQTVTYSWPLNPNGDRALIEFQRGTMMPAVERIMKETYRTLALGYGGYRDPRAPEKGWQTLDPQPRYITNYIGLRNRLAILDENYVHADYKTRVISNYNFLLAVLDYCYANADALLKMAADVDARTVARGLAPKPADTFGLDFDLRALPQPVTVLGFEMESVPREGAPPQMKRTDRKKTFTIPYFADFVQKTTVPLPAGYLVSPANAEVVEKLLLHGLLVERLIAPAKLDVQSFKIKEIKAAANLYQGHRTNTLTGEYAAETREFPAGTVYVSLAQPLANLAAYLLEPRSDDGLLVWNFFDREIVGQWAREPSPCPVYKLMAPAPLVKQTVR
ncbi:MAG: hypothetical protein FJY80_02235 [Candidatus Aminicenantes bacterium]|nr:hypothetical protein [Candidatus Aminicenantes bacterium]